MDLPIAERFGWGGRRKGAGRKDLRGAVKHRPRPFHAARFPVHVTLRAVREVGYLRSKKPYAVIEEAIRKAAAARTDFRIVQFSVQHNHLHFIVEAEDENVLGRGMQGLAIRIARGLNRLLHRSGAVFAERYHRHELKSPRETRAALAYVLQNFRRHQHQRGRSCPRGWIDDCSSAPWFEGWKRAVARPTEDSPVVAAGTWFLRVGWELHGRIDPDEIPGGRGAA
jgi:REP element-mobilizing transposase RayT